MKDERTLVEGCRNKDRISQRTLYERFAGRMFAVCQRYTRSRFEAEDVLQEAFVKVFGQIHTFRYDCPLEAWIKRVVINTAISYLRKEKPYLDQADVDNHMEVASETETALSGIQYQQLLAMVRELPPGCQSVFNLYAIEGYQHNEIAEMLGISEGTSKSQYARAKQLLQAKILESAERK
ncbi:RNA polymerase sigma factor [Runella zeae]|jgi:RNA polymerase sigma factor (sigma-70 family)|uniref:RNA polymerase sigma factor n=1 Tax=Runella zeae TaxID=94255 RepID=UPI0003FA2829|nr:RNA polymerase sigma factor [Runella zeae]